MHCSQHGVKDHHVKILMWIISSPKQNDGFGPILMSILQMDIRELECLPKVTWVWKPSLE